MGQELVRAFLFYFYLLNSRNGLAYTYLSRVYNFSFCRL